MISWWNQKTIQTAERLWKPTLQPIGNERIRTCAWFQACRSSFQAPPPPLDLLKVRYPVLKPVKDGDEIKTCLRTRKIKLNPTHGQRLQLAKWWDHYRFTYNKTVEAIIDDVQDDNDNVFRLLVPMEVNSATGAISLSFGCQLEPSSDLKVRMEVNTKDPKVGVKLTYSKKKGVSMKLTVKNDPWANPVKLSIGYEYPKPRSFQDYRNQLVTKAAVQAQPWYKGFDYPNDLLSTNKHLREGAVTQALAAYKTICTTAKVHGTHGRLRTMFRKKKNESWSMSLSRECVSKTSTKTSRGKTVDAVSLCPSVLKEPIACWESLPDFVHDPKIHKDRWGDYWLLVPIDKAIKTRKPPSEVKRFVALDAGEKTFLTAYSTEGDITSIGGNTREVLRSLFAHIDRLQSMLDRQLFHSRTLRHVREKVIKLWKRAGHLVNDLHWKVAQQLTQENDLIVLGKLGVQSILRSESITKTVKRVLQHQGHYRFRMRLLEKGEEMGVPVRIWSEWGTTKGCPCCGRAVQVGASRQFQCPQCSYQADRDAKAGCCIMLKYLADTW